ncbi:Pentatricopeptide repeat-containing protein [Raphanus sativus]|nr:Pentatricopeptide repeat-containing protein [Raphanus sativus]
MIRAKQISNLSSTARSFFLGGTTRSGAADGNSCTSADDESCVLRRQQARNEAVLTGKRASTLAAGLAGNVLPAEAKVEHFARPSLLPQHVSSPVLPVKPDSVTHVPVIVEEDTVAPIGDQMFKAGIGAVNFLSDIANYKIPLTDGTEVVGLPKSCMVDPSRPITSVKSSNVKVIRREDLSKVYPKEAERSGLRQPSSDVAGKPFEPQDLHTTTVSGKRKSMPQRTNTDSTRYASGGCDFNVHSSDDRTMKYPAEGFSKPSREMVRVTPGTGPTTRQHCNSGYVVENVSNILRRFKWGPAAEEALHNVGLRVDAYQANQVLKQMDNYTNALGFFYWLKRQPGFKHDGHTYTTMVGNLGRAKQFGEINKLLDEMVREGCQPNTVTYNRLIHSYGRANYLREAMNVFQPNARGWM